jgi:hypothetical protein
MKTFLPQILGIALIPFHVHSQGTVNFSNFAGVGTFAVDAPVTNAAGIRIVGPGPYVADLFWSSNTNAPVDSLTPAGFNQPFSTTTFSGGGYFVAGSKTLPTADWILAQVRVWDTTYGATYAQARDAGGEFGFSNLILVIPSIPPGPPTILVGLHGFQLMIPEPSSVALALIGGATLFFFRCRARRSARPNTRT